MGKKNKIRVDGVDSAIDVFAKELKKNNKAVIEEQKKIMKDYTWKDMNKQKNLEKLYTSSAIALVDPKKEQKRNEKMLDNITKLMFSNGTIVIIIGCGHLDFLEKNLKDSIFPLR